MALVIILIILGIFLLGVEVFLLPGITVAGIGALISCGFGIYEAFVKYGNAVTRLAPGGKVMLNGKTYEAKSIDVYIDPHREVEVIGFDNFTVVVKPLSRSAEEEA